ncbi:MAG TPA: GTP cyclohydrolase I FolE [bacterium]|nr:GTP cyclohydrolase I FolE [bacterium]
MDKPVIEQAVRDIIDAIGEDGGREGLRGTPRRIAEAYEELFSGLKEDPSSLLEVGFDDEDHHEMVVVKDIPFFSMCEHHFLPFHGVAHVGYIPAGRILGISKVARLVDILARRPQVQERLTSQVADFLCEGGLKARGAAVVIEAQHLCIEMRGIKKPGSKVVTSATRGIFREDARTRAEFFAIVEGGR